MNRLIAACILPLPLLLCGCPAVTAALGMGAAGTVLGGLGVLGGTIPATISLKQEFSDVEAITALVHQHEMTISAIEQSPIVAMVPTPVMVTPGTPMAPPVVTPVPVQPIPSGPGGPIVTPNRH